MRVNQVVSVARPSKERRLRYAERNASWTASSASSRFRRIAWAVATNLGREATNIFSKASTPMSFARVSARWWDSCLPGLQDVDRAFLFRPLKACKGLLTAAAALVRLVKFAAVDALVIGGSPFSLLGPCSNCVSNAQPSSENLRSVLFSTERGHACR